jgi:hypothetical protein
MPYICRVRKTTTTFKDLKMRKVTEIAVTNWLMRKKFRRDNTHTDGTTLYLHGHPIAKIDDNDGMVYVRSAGWETKTTKERLNGIAGVHIHQKNYQWFLNGQPWINSQDWTPIGKFNYDYHKYNGVPIIIY